MIRNRFAGFPFATSVASPTHSAFVALPQFAKQPSASNPAADLYQWALEMAKKQVAQRQESKRYSYRWN